MFNTYTNDQSIQINAVGGTIVKNYQKSFFIRFHIKSPLADRVFSENASYAGNGRFYKPIVVLQTMLCGDGELLAEVMWKEDFNKMFELEESR